jgi:hypothetical protein
MTSQIPEENAAGVFAIAISVTVPQTSGQFIISSTLYPDKNTFTDKGLGFSTG